MLNHLKTYFMLMALSVLSLLLITCSFAEEYPTSEKPANANTNAINEVDTGESVMSSTKSRPASGIDALKHRFGMGVQVGGETGVYGLQASIFLRQDLSLQLGLGTGYDYYTSGLAMNYYFLGSFVRPFFKIAAAYWHSKNPPQPKEKLFPLFLPFNFYRDQADQALNLIAFFPTFGVQAELDNGIKISAELMSVLAPFLSNGPKTALHLAFGFLFFF